MLLWVSKVIIDWILSIESCRYATTLCLHCYYSTCHLKNLPHFINFDKNDRQKFNHPRRTTTIIIMTLYCIPQWKVTVKKQINNASRCGFFCRERKFRTMVGKEKLIRSKRSRTELAMWTVDFASFHFAPSHQSVVSV